MKIALVENFGSDFYGARVRYALFLKKRGHQVIAIVPDDGYVDKIRQTGIDTVALKMDIRKRNLISMFRFARGLKKVFKNEDFDIIHLYRMQPNLIGSIVAYYSSRRSKIFNHITGLGVAFTKNTLKYRIIRFIIKSAYNINSSFFNAKLVFQNVEDRMELGNKQDFAVVKGSAVNEERFHPTVEVNERLHSELEKKIKIKGNINLIFVSRLLKQKGLSYLIEAVRQYNALITADSDPKINLIVAGWIDSNNPDSFTEKEIESFGQNDNMVFLGRRDDINELISLTDIAALPTFYREGTPRFLLEAMAMAKPILTTDMPGCNHLVENFQNGALVQPKSVEALVDVLGFLAKQDLKNMGVRSFQIYNEKFSERVVYNQLLNIYNS